MSWIQVNFSLVRYSPLEGTHYFYDPVYPSAIQFLLDGKWESWDVGWVRYKAQDPDVRRIAEDAEARLIRDHTLGYRQWPAPPSRSSPTISGHLSSHSAGDSPLSSPLYSDIVSPIIHHHLHGQPHGLHPASPQLHGRVAAAPPAPVPFSPFYPTPSLPPTSNPVQAQHAPSAPHTRSIVDSPYTDSSPTSSFAPLASYSPTDSNRNDTPTSPLPLATNRETKVLLSLDGDGARGLSSVLLVESLVNAICVKIGRQVSPYQIFDLMGGTSTGGLLAILLGRLRMQAHSARESYKQISKQVYLNKKAFFVSLDSHIPTPSQFDGQALEDEIKSVVRQETGHQDEVFLDPRTDSADVFVVSTQIDIGTNKPALIRSYQTRRITGPELDANMTVWEAMKATSAAPRWMQPRDGYNRRPVIEPGLVDHGFTKNNPVRDLLYECRKLYRYANDMMVIVSIGTGQGVDRMNEVNEMANSVEDRTTEAMVWGSKFEMDNQALIERSWMKYFRFNVPDLDNVPLAEWCQEDLIKEKTLAYLGRPDIGQAFYACVDAITAILIGDLEAPLR